MSEQRVNRRGFLGTAGIAAAAALGPAAGADLPKVVNPRATDGDVRAEPNWDERFTLTVGTKDGDLTGKDDRVLQAAVDYVARMGGGTVKLLPGTWRLRNAVFLPSRLRLLGSGPETILTKIASATVPIDGDSNWFDQEITLKDVKEARSFQVGDGVFLQVKNPFNQGETVIKRTLTARAGNRFKLDKGLRENVWLSGNPTCSSLFPLLTSEHTADVVIEDLVLDGNRENNTNMNGNYGGCIFIQDCNRYTFRKVVTRDYNGDGISFQICHDVVVEDCHSHDNADLGIHAGSGSQRPLIKNSRMERNSQGLFWCWGVKFGLAQGCRMEGNRDYGISIGHCDTDNVMRENVVSNSGKVGVLFRDENRGRDFWPNRNTLERCRIENSGGQDGVAIDIRGKTKDVKLLGNTLRESRAPMQRIGLKIGAEVGPLVLDSNKLEGFAQPMLDQRK